MAVFRIEKQKNYTVMSNYHLRDKTLSFKAKGLLSFMLSLPDDWDYSMKGLVAVSKENIKAIRTILNELKEHGYIEIRQTRAKNGYYKYEYIIREIPEDIESLDNDTNTDAKKGNAVTGKSEKVKQISNKKMKTKRKIVRDVKGNLPFVDLEELNPLTLDLITNKFIDMEDTQIYYYDNLFEKLLREGHSYQKVITMTHYIISRVIARGFIDEDGNKVENKFGFFKGAINNCIIKLKNNEDLEIDPETGWLKELEV